MIAHHMDGVLRTKKTPVVYVKQETLLQSISCMLNCIKSVSGLKGNFKPGTIHITTFKCEMLR